VKMEWAMPWKLHISLPFIPLLEHQSRGYAWLQGRLGNVVSLGYQHSASVYCFGRNFGEQLADSAMAF
jgi:hypothetical protein